MSKIRTSGSINVFVCCDGLGIMLPKAVQSIRSPLSYRFQKIAIPLIINDLNINYIKTYFMQIQETFWNSYVYDVIGYTAAVYCAGLVIAMLTALSLAYNELGRKPSYNDDLLKLIGTSMVGIDRVFLKSWYGVYLLVTNYLNR